MGQTRALLGASFVWALPWPNIIGKKLARVQQSSLCIPKLQWISISDLSWQIFQAGLIVIFPNKAFSLSLYQGTVGCFTEVSSVLTIILHLPEANTLAYFSAASVTKTKVLWEWDQSDHASFGSILNDRFWRVETDSEGRHFLHLTKPALRFQFWNKERTLFSYHFFDIFSCCGYFKTFHNRKCYLFVISLSVCYSHLLPPWSNICRQG